MQGGEWFDASGAALPDGATSDVRKVYTVLTAAVLDIGALYALAVRGDCGGVASFVGTTRDTFEGKIVERLEYEAYNEMALTAMRQIGLRALAYDDKSDTALSQAEREAKRPRTVIVAHRLGTVPVGEASVAIFVTSPHRASGLLSVHAAIDDLKAQVPIWKKEVYARGKRARSPGGDGADDAAWKSNKEFHVVSATAPIAPAVAPS